VAGGRVFTIPVIRRQTVTENLSFAASGRVRLQRTHASADAQLPPKNRETCESVCFYERHVLYVVVAAAATTGKHATTAPPTYTAC